MLCFVERRPWERAWGNASGLGRRWSLNNVWRLLEGFLDVLQAGKRLSSYITRLTARCSCPKPEGRPKPATPTNENIYNGTRKHTGYLHGWSDKEMLCALRQAESIPMKVSVASTVPTRLAAWKKKTVPFLEDWCPVCNREGMGRWGERDRAVPWAGNYHRKIMAGRSLQVDPPALTSLSPRVSTTFWLYYARYR